MTATGAPAIIEKLLLDRALLMVTQGPTLPVSLPDAPFTKPVYSDNSMAPYLEVLNLPNRHAWEALAASGGYVGQGIFQVNVHWPKVKGSIASQNVAGQVAAFFPKGLKLYGTGITVTIYKTPETAPPVIDADTMVPVSIYYKANVSA